MEDLLISATKDYISDNFNSALEKLSKVITSNSENFSQEALLYRATTYRKLGEFQKSLEDLEHLLKSINQNTKIDSFEMFFKLGQIHFDMEKFQDSSDYLKKALTISSNEEQREKLIIWMNKLELESKENHLVMKDVENKDNLENLQTESTIPMVNKQQIKFVHNWYQTQTHIVISIDSSAALNNIDYSIGIEKKSIHVNKGNEQEKSCLFEINLCNSVIPSESTFSINGRKIEIKLKKEVQNFQWVTLEKQNSVNPVNTAGNIQGFKPTYPSSSKVQKDWDNIDKEISREIDKEEVTGNDAMMKLFKNIYERGNEETRRAMVKSFQTSGGTVLSTNWGEVKDKEYEGKDRPTAPDGQEWADKVNKEK